MASLNKVEEVIRINKQCRVRYVGDHNLLKFVPISVYVPINPTQQSSPSKIAQNQPGTAYLKLIKMSYWFTPGDTLENVNLHLAHYTHSDSS